MSLDHVVSILASPNSDAGVCRIVFQVEGIDSSVEVLESLLRLGRSMATDIGWTRSGRRQSLLCMGVR
jgi:hypothetical protein